MSYNFYFNVFIQIENIKKSVIHITSKIITQFTESHTLSLLIRLQKMFVLNLVLPNNKSPCYFPTAISICLRFPMRRHYNNWHDFKRDSA